MNDTTPSVRNFLEFVVRSLVAHPDSIEITEIETKQETTFELGLDPDDLAAISGNGGEIAAALHTVVDACAYKQHTRARLVILGAEEELAPASEADDGEEATI